MSELWHCLILLVVLEASWFCATLIIFVDNNNNNNNNTNNNASDDASPNTISVDRQTNADFSSTLQCQSKKVVPSS